jgi:GNAT superfamily N-acetyltransferase
VSDVLIRNLRPADEARFLEVQSATFKGLEYLPRVRIGVPGLIPEGSFIAEKNGAIVGSVGVIKLGHEGWFEIRNLAIRDPKLGGLAKELLAKSLEYVDREEPQYVKAATHAVQPYVDLYKQSGFEPIRRTIRVGWEFPTAYSAEQGKVKTRSLSGEFAEEAAKVWVEGLLPYWDWWIQEQGGQKELADWVKASVAKDQGWIGAFVDGKLVGLSILRPDAYGPGEARFNGAYTIPNFREQGVGSALMGATIEEAARLRQKKMKVYTLAYLDHLAPGAILYLKSNGKIEAEYLQLQKKS